MKKSLFTLALLVLAFASVSPAQNGTIGKLNWLSGDTGIVLRGGMGPAGYVIGRAPSGDSLTWLEITEGGSTNIDSVTGLGTGVANALKVNVGSAGAFVVFGGALGTPSSGTLTNATGLPLGGITGFGTGIATWLATPSSANLRAAVTDETGTSGGLVFAGSPSLSSPTLTGTPVLPASFTIGSNTFARSGAHGLTLTTTGTTSVTFPTSGTLYGTATGSITSSQLAASLTNETGTGVAVFNISPTFTGVANFETINVDSLNAGKITGAVDLDSVVLAGLTPGNLLTVNGDGKVVDNSAVKVGSSQLAFFNGTLRSKITLDCPTDLNDFNPVTSTEANRDCIASLVAALRGATGVNLFD